MIILFDFHHLFFNLNLRSFEFTKPQCANENLKGGEILYHCSIDLFRSWNL